MLTGEKNQRASKTNRPANTTSIQYVSCQTRTQTLVDSQPPPSRQRSLIRAIPTARTRPFKYLPTTDEPPTNPPSKEKATKSRPKHELPPPLPKETPAGAPVPRTFGSRTPLWPAAPVCRREDLLPPSPARPWACFPPAPRPPRAEASNPSPRGSATTPAAAEPRRTDASGSAAAPCAAAAAVAAATERASGADAAATAAACAAADVGGSHPSSRTRSPARTTTRKRTPPPPAAGACHHHRHRCREGRQLAPARAPASGWPQTSSTGRRFGT